jgi:hypothetical protein
MKGPVWTRAENLAVPVFLCSLVFSLYFIRITRFFVWSALNYVLCLYCTTHTKHKHPFPRWDSNQKSQQAIGRRPSPQTRSAAGIGSIRSPDHRYTDCTIAVHYLINNSQRVPELYQRLLEVAEIFSVQSWHLSVLMSFVSSVLWRPR